MSRLFVALWPPEAVLDALEALPRPELLRLRWTTRGQWHVTLRFLGAADRDVTAAALQTLRHVAVDVAVSGRVRRLGRDSLVVPVFGADSLAAAVGEVTADIGRPPGRRFVGHLTLARTRDQRQVPLPELRVEVAWRADEVALVDSTLTSRGSEYRTVATVPLLPWSPPGP